MAVIGQEKPIKIGLGLKYEGGELVPTPGKSGTAFTTKSDTTAVYMLITDKVEHDYPVMLRQVKGYSVTKGNSIVSTYLDINKQPLPDDVIVWLSIKR